MEKCEHNFTVGNCPWCERAQEFDAGKSLDRFRSAKPTPPPASPVGVDPGIQYRMDSDGRLVPEAAPSEIQHGKLFEGKFIADEPAPSECEHRWEYLHEGKYRRCVVCLRGEGGKSLEPEPVPSEWAEFVPRLPAFSAKKAGNDKSASQPCKELIDIKPAQDSDADKARDAEIDKLFTYHGCLSGDCPHEKQEECFRCIAEESWESAMRYAKGKGE